MFKVSPLIVNSTSIQNSFDLSNWNLKGYKIYIYLIRLLYSILNDKLFILLLRQGGNKQFQHILSTCCLHRTSNTNLINFCVTLNVPNFRFFNFLNFLFLHVFELLAFVWNSNFISSSLLVFKKMQNLKYFSCSYLCESGEKEYRN